MSIKIKNMLPDQKEQLIALTNQIHSILHNYSHEICLNLICNLFLSAFLAVRSSSDEDIWDETIFILREKYYEMWNEVHPPKDTPSEN